MLADETNISQNTAEDLLDSIPEETIRAREDYYWLQSALQQKMDKLTAEIQQLSSKEEILEDLLAAQNKE